MSEKGTILYVEDNPDNRNLVRRVLGADDYTVDEGEERRRCAGISKDQKA